MKSHDGDSNPWTFSAEICLFFSPLVLFHTCVKRSHAPISTLVVFLEDKEAFWDANMLCCHHPVLQEEVLPSGPAGRWILQPQLLQGREHLQGTQRNHLPRLMHGRCSGTGSYPPWLLNPASHSLHSACKNNSKVLKRTR